MKYDAIKAIEMNENEETREMTQQKFGEMIGNYEKKIKELKDLAKISIFEALKMSEKEWLYGKILYTILDSDDDYKMVKSMAQKAQRFFPKVQKTTNLRSELYTDNQNKDRVDLYFEVGNTVVLMELKVRNECRDHQLADYYFDLEENIGSDMKICIFYVTPTGQMPKNMNALVYSRNHEKKLVYENLENANLFSISYSDLAKNFSIANGDSDTSLDRLINEFLILCRRMENSVTGVTGDLKAFHIAYLYCLKTELTNRLASSEFGDFAVVDDSECFSENLGLDSTNDFYQSISLMPKKCKEDFGWKLCFEVGYSCLVGNRTDREHLRILYGIKRTKMKNKLLKTDVETMFKPFLESNIGKGLYWNGVEKDVKSIKKKWQIIKGVTSRHINNDWWLIAHIADWLESILQTCHVDDELTTPEKVAEWMFEDFIAIMKYQTVDDVK